MYLEKPKRVFSSIYYYLLKNTLIKYYIFLFFHIINTSSDVIAWRHTVNVTILPLFMHFYLILLILLIFNYFNFQSNFNQLPSNQLSSHFAKKYFVSDSSILNYVWNYTLSEGGSRDYAVRQTFLKYYRKNTNKSHSDS